MPDPTFTTKALSYSFLEILRTQVNPGFFLKKTDFEPANKSPNFLIQTAKGLACSNLPMIIRDFFRMLKK